MFLNQSNDYTFAEQTLFPPPQKKKKKIRDFRQNTLQIYFSSSCDRRIRTIPVIVSVTGFESRTVRVLPEALTSRRQSC